MLTTLETDTHNGETSPKAFRSFLRDPPSAAAWNTETWSAILGADPIQLFIFFFDFIFFLDLVFRAHCIGQE